MNAPGRLIVTEVLIRPVAHANPRLLAFANIVINGALKINGLRVVRGNGRLFVAMPSHADDRKHYDIVHPLDSATRAAIEAAVIGEYQKQQLPSTTAGSRR